MSATNPATTTYASGTTPAPKLPLAGSGATAPELGSTGHAQAVHAKGSVMVPLDAFAKRGGPDVAVQTAQGMIRVHAVFQVDPSTRELTVSVVDEAGQLIRIIPSESVARMIAAMASYRGR